MNSFIFKFFYPLKTFAWKILHGRVKARPSGQNAPVTVRDLQEAARPPQVGVRELQAAEGRAREMTGSTLGQTSVPIATGQGILQLPARGVKNVTPMATTQRLALGATSASQNAAEISVEIAAAPTRTL